MKSDHLKKRISELRDELERLEKLESNRFYSAVSEGFAWVSQPSPNLICVCLQNVWGYTDQTPAIDMDYDTARAFAGRILELTDE